MDDDTQVLLTNHSIDTSQYYVIRKGEYDDMQTRIERLQEQLADAHDMINNMTEHIYRIHRNIQEARRG